VVRSDEAYRHQCEVRWCLRQGRAWFGEYVAGVKQKRGEAAAKALWADVMRQAKLGNTGRPGDWRKGDDGS
jgi:hypothetical protein